MEKYTEEQLLELLAKDREAGAEAVWEMYSGLIWRVCARRLQNVEDVKESVNSTFADFCMNWQQYDSSKGTLRNYICTIGDRKAMELYRKNDARHRAEEKAIQGEAEGQVWLEYPSEDGRIEKLEEALKTLSPLDEKILRMKYYDGMTFKEIAAKMELPYDTVKKRGERSLKKLWKILIVALLLAALTGCALRLYRYFRFSEKGGISWDVETPLYELEGEGPSVELNGIRIGIADAVYQDGVLIVKYSGQVAQPMEIEERFQGMVASVITDAYTVPMLPDGGSGGVNNHVRVPGGSINVGIYQWEPFAEGEEISVHIGKLLEGVSWEDAIKVISPEYAEKLDLTEYPLEFTFTLKEVEVQKGNLENLGDVFRFDGGGFLIRKGKEMLKGALVPLYPFDVDADFTVSNRVNGSLTGYRSDESILLRGQNGETYPLTTPIGGQVFDREVKELYFEGSLAGEYTLQIPYLILNSLELPEEQSFLIPEKTDQYQELDLTFQMKDGSKLRITGVTRSTYESVEVDVLADGQIVEQHVEYPEILFDYEIISEEKDPAFYGVRFCVQYEVAGESGAIQTQKASGIMSVGENQSAVRFLWHGGTIQQKVIFRIDEAEFVLEKDYEIPITIE